MHRAPAVNFWVGRSRWHLGGVVMLSVASLIVMLAFALNQAIGDWRFGAIVATALAAPVLGVRGWQASATGHLRWDGQHWHWSGFASDCHCHLSLLADLQRVMLVRLSAADQPAVWLWLEQSTRGADWLPLRRAIVSSLPGSGDTDSGLVDKGELA